MIRGPGGTLWGANAVNGVINVITKSAKDTQGALVTYGGGSEDQALGGFRYGGNNGDGLHWRIYGKHFERDTGALTVGPHDDWRMGRGGFRVDWDPEQSQTDHLTFQGDYYGGRAGHDLTLPTLDSPFTERDIRDSVLSGANVLGRWTHTFDEESDWALQLYYDRVRRDQRLVFEKIDTFDIDFQHRFPLGSRQRIIWGLGHRLIRDDLETDRFSSSFNPQQRTTQRFGGFVQDEITLVEDRLAFTIGTKLSTNDYSGFEWQPSARLLWTPNRQNSVWAAVSRAVRTPNRVNEDMSMNAAVFQFSPFLPKALFRIDGNWDLESEELIAYEMGYRAQVTDRVAFDVATFYNVYERLIGYEYGTFFIEGPVLVVPPPTSRTTRVPRHTVWNCWDSGRFAKTYGWPPRTVSNGS